MNDKVKSFFEIGDYVEILANGSMGVIANINNDNGNPYWIESENNVKAWYNINEFKTSIK